MKQSTQATARARNQVTRVASEIVRAQAVLALTDRQLARLAGVSPTTVGKVRIGAPTVRVDTLCTIAGAVGLDLSLRAYPGRGPSLRDTGQMGIAEMLCAAAHASWRSALELAVGEYERSADLVFFGPDEIIHQEIERLLLDFQLQYRSAKRKREALAAAHSRPVRLVLVAEDTHRNRRVAAEHASLITRELPAGSREIMGAIRSGRPLGRDGLLWVRQRAA